jgi:hypothetical protein
LLPVPVQYSGATSAPTRARAGGIFKEGVSTPLACATIAISSATVTFSRGTM